MLQIELLIHNCPPSVPAEVFGMTYRSKELLNGEIWLENQLECLKIRTKCDSWFPVGKHETHFGREAAQKCSNTKESSTKIHTASPLPEDDLHKASQFRK